MSEDNLDYENLRESPSTFVSKIIGVEPFDYQKEFMNHPSSKKVFQAGRQVGKSRTASWMALHHAVTNPGSLVLITADALRQSSELFNQLLSEISESGLSDEHWGIERSTQTVIEFSNDSRIKVVPTGRNGHKIRGFTADMVIVDEADFVDDKIFEEIIEPMLWVNDGEFVIASTPFGASGYFYDKAKLAEIEGSDWFKVHAEPTDNPLVDEEDIESYKEGKTSKQIKQEVYGRFVDSGDQFFPDTLIKNSLSDDVERGVKQYPTENSEKRVDRNADIYLGVDIASSGADETVLAVSDEYGNIFSIEQHDISIPEAKKRIKTLDNHYNFEKINIDRTGLGDGVPADLRSDIGRKVDDVYLSTQKKQSIYQNFKAKLEAGEVIIQNKKDVRVQMSNLGFSKTASNNLSIHAKGDFHDDIVDAMAIVVWALPSTSATSSGRSNGMKSMIKIGERKGRGRDNRGYSFNSDEDDGGEYMSTSEVKTTSIRRN